MASLTAAQAQNLVDQALQFGDRWQRSLPAFVSPASVPQLNTILSPLLRFLTGAQVFCVVQATGIVKGWTSATTDAVKLGHIGAAVGTVLAAENAVAAGSSASNQNGGNLVATLATLT